MRFKVREIVDPTPRRTHSHTLPTIPAGAPRSTLQIKAPRCLNPANA